MTKSDVVKEISSNTGMEQGNVLTVVENFMETIRKANNNNKTVYLRGFGTFGLVRRAEKLGRNISKGTSVVIPAHVIPKFKPSNSFKESVRNNHSTKG